MPPVITLDNQVTALLRRIGTRPDGVALADVQPFGRNYDMNLFINGQGPAFLGNVIISDCEPGSTEGSGNE